MLTGDRPTGPLHLGHYVGTLTNRVRHQHAYESYFVIADLHMLTTKHRPEDMRVADTHARQLVLDALAAGRDPQAVTFYLQSAIPEIHELYTLLQHLISVARLARLPSLKDMARAARIYAGTVSQDGLLWVRATSVGRDTTLARIVHRVEQAQEEKAPAQRALERFACWYTPAIIVLSGASLLLTRDIDLALTLLVIGCPGARAPWPSRRRLPWWPASAARRSRAS